MQRLVRNINTASDWFNIFTKVFGCLFSLLLFIFKCQAMTSCPTMLPQLKMTAEAIQKRQYRVEQREKRRRSFFINDYVLIKYPQLFKEANEAYLQMVSKYPGKADLTKVYYFKKWKAEMMSSREELMVPHLPVLIPSELLLQSLPEVQPTEQSSPEVQSTDVQSPPEVQSTGQSPPEVQSTDVQSPPEVQPTGQSPPEVQSTVVQSPPEVHQTVEVQTTTQDNLTSGMTLDEMRVTVDEMVRALQSDQELMDLVENFDLPDSVWNNELAVPDYVLESDLEW